MYGLRGVFRGYTVAFEAYVGVFRGCPGGNWRQLPPQRSFRGVRRGQSGHLEAFPVLVPPFKGPFEVLPRPRTPRKVPPVTRKCLILRSKTPFRPPRAPYASLCVLFGRYITTNSSLNCVITPSSTPTLPSNTLQNPSNTAV